MTLKELQIGKSAVVDTVGGSGALRQHFLDMGLIPGAEFWLLKRDHRRLQTVRPQQQKEPDEAFSVWLPPCSLRSAQ